VKTLTDRFKRYYGALTQIFREHRDYRIQVFQLARADIVKTYRGSALGWLWAVIKPTVTIFVFWFAFTVGLRSGGDVSGYPFFLWLLAGFIPWFYMSEMITQGSKCLSRYSYLVTKIKFPVSTIPTFVSISKFYVHMALLSLVVAFFLLFGYQIDIYYLQLPIYMFLNFLFFTLWALFSAPLAAVSKDFAEVIASFVTAIFWMSGIMWDVNKISIPWIKTILLFNPVTFIATGYRNVFVYKQWFWEDTFALGAFAIMLTGMFLLALYTYQKLRRDIADVL
jgi:teichoic acid transport system permease protein